MWTIPVPSSSETSSQGMTRCCDLAAGAELVERAAVREPDELLAEDAADEALVGVPGDRDPFAALTQAVLGVGLDRSGDVRRQRPGRRRPDHDGLAVPVEQREAHVQRRVASVLVDARLCQLVLRERGAAARAPLGRAMPEVEPPALVDDAEESPDVLDVRVAEREVVVPPVHPLPEPDGALGQSARGVDDHLAAPPSELGEPVLLDLALRVEPEPPLHADLDPEPLAVEPVLVALVVAAERLVTLEDVLQRPPPGGVDGEDIPIGRHRAVDEAEPRTVGVLLAQPPEGSLALPEVEDRALERVVIRLVRERCEHAVDSRMCAPDAVSEEAPTGRVFGRPSFSSVRNLTRQSKRKDPWHST